MKTNNRVILVALSLLAVGSELSFATLDDAFVGDTKAYFSRLERLGFAGVVVIAEAGKPALAQGCGLADRERGLPWTPKTVSTIGSITKQFTAAGIARLQDEGRLNVNDTLDKYFPDSPSDKAAITLHQLLTHSSGLRDPEGIDDFDPIGRDEYVREVLSAPLASAPGGKYEYANANFSLLGAVIEIVTGRSYEDAMRALVFDPAGLTHTGYKKPRWGDSVIAQGYEGGKRWGTVLERPMGEDGPYWALRANGGIHSTSEDMVRWADVLLHGSFLEAGTRDALWTPYVDESNGDGASFYGYGWSIVDITPGVRVITHNGGNGVFFADLAIVPSRDVVVFLQTNVLSEFPAADDLLVQIGRRLFENEAYPRVPDAVALDPARLETWAGRYRLQGGDEFTVSVDGNSLRVLPRGWSAWAYVHSPPDQDIEPLSALSRETDRIVEAFVGGDFAPLFEAYGKAVPVEDLEAAYGERTARWQEEFGPFKGYEVLGTGAGPGRFLTAVRFRHERGDVTRAYAWERGGEGRLLGMVMRPFDTGRRFFPIGDNRLESWDPSTGVSIPARIDASPRSVSVTPRADTATPGAFRLVLLREDREVPAERIE